MAFDPSIVGFTTKPYPFAFDWKTLAVYTLGIGAKRDEIDYLYEGAKNGMKVYPTFAVIPAQGPIMEMLGKTGGNPAMIVHGGQKVRAHRSIPASGTLETTGTIKGVYDMKKFAQVVMETNTRLSGEPLFDSEWSIMYRGQGNFDGPRPPEGPPEPSVPKDRAPDWTFEESTSPEQAYLYRISGDINPLHADPDFAAMVGFPEGPILHGLCTYGFVARAVVKNVAAGDATKLRSFSAQFRKPVWPGDTLVTQGYNLEGGKVALLTHAKGRTDPVLTNAWAQIG